MRKIRSEVSVGWGNDDQSAVVAWDLSKPSWRVAVAQSSGEGLDRNGQTLPRVMRKGIIGRKELSSQHILFLGLDTNACANGRLLEEKLRDLFR